MAKITIDKKIVKFAVAKEEAEKKPPAQPEPEEQKVIQLHEKLERPEVLIGSTYKVKPRCRITRCTSRSTTSC
jgi:hypothetical protein